MKSSDTEKQFAQIVAALRCRPGASLGTSKKKGFGSSALCVDDKIFAMISSKGDFVVKLPKDRVDALVASGRGKRFGPGPGRVMKEWLAVNLPAGADWLILAEEAFAFVGKRNEPGAPALGRAAISPRRQR